MTVARSLGQWKTFFNPDSVVTQLLRSTMSRLLTGTTTRGGSPGYASPVRERER